MRVAIIAKSIHPIMVGGAERVTKEIYDALKQQKFNVKLFLKYKRKPSERPELGTEIDLKWTKDILREIKKFDPDIIFVTRYWGELCPIYIEDKPIFAVHPSVEIEKYNIESSFKQYLIEMAQRIFSQDNIIHIVPSPFAKKYYTKFSQNPCIYVVPLGFDKRTSPINIRDKFSEKVTITYIGRIAQKKGLELFLKILQDFGLSNRVRVIIAGRIMKDYYNFKRIIKEYQNKGLDVKYLGYINEKTKTKLLMKSEMTIQPSLYGESFGIACLECLYYNGLLLASDIFRETGVVNDECCFIFNRGNPAELEKTLYHALGLPIEEINNIIFKARSWSEKFTWNRFRKKIVSLIEDAF